MISGSESTCQSACAGSHDVRCSHTRGRLIELEDDLVFVIGQTAVVLCSLPGRVPLSPAGKVRTRRVELQHLHCLEQKVVLFPTCGFIAAVRCPGLCEDRIAWRDSFDSELMEEVGLRKEGILDVAAGSVLLPRALKPSYNTIPERLRFSHDAA
jgi:hypothetical protein